MATSIRFPHHISTHGKLNKASVQSLLTPPLLSNVLRFEILSSSMVEKEALSKLTRANPPTEDMDLKNLNSFAQNPNARDDANGDFESSARDRKMTKKPKTFLKSRN
ncbi:hypothetical protein ES332_A05G372800v1 [Gossypium tomentosum]|uniref:Uncharacterized protein n=1 Tax=Gossypium tomentosum TaxID=34277 RepID=A0A5D2QPV8_GOSTO|nr:hypothetical protein ES332_A05G372800v1 [Gossypium tomentosum]